MWLCFISGQNTQQNPENTTGVLLVWWQQRGGTERLFLPCSHLRLKVLVIISWLALKSTLKERQQEDLFLG